MNFQAITYFKKGLSCVPVGKDKLPTIKWKNRQTELVRPSGEFDDSHGIAIVCGKVSGNMEIIDFDTKYDNTGTLMERYKALVQESDKGLLKKMLVEQSPSGGYHFIYRSEGLEGNKKLAQRFTTEAERVENPKEKVKVLIETRGEGGYFVCAPSPGYVIKQGSMDSIPEISVDERNLLISCAISLNEVVETHKPHIPKDIPKAQGITPLNDYNERGDVLQLLLDEGWTIGNENSLQYFLKRPGTTTSKWSASLRKADRIFYVFSTSTEFDSNKAYAPGSVFGILKHGGNFHEAAKDLVSKGFGEQSERKATPAEKPKPPTVTEDDTDFSFLSPLQEMFDYINDAYAGVLPMGLSTGIPALDGNFRFKRGKFNIIGGQDNVGKSIIIWYLLVLSAMLHDWKWLIVSVENGSGFIMRKLMEFYLCKPIKKMSEQELKQASKFVLDHFFIVTNKKQYTYTDILAMGNKMKKKHNIDGIMIDPYNAVVFDEKDLKTLGDHNYHYKVTSAFRNFTDNNDCCIYLNCHAVTDALRRVWMKDTAPDKELVGHPMPPKKSDVEGGGKFANRADDFLIIHRYTQVESRYNITEIHVTKVKETETGGRPTPRDKPIKLEMCGGGCGFIDVDAKFNAVTKRSEIDMSELPEHWQNK